MQIARWAAWPDGPEHKQWVKSLLHFVCYMIQHSSHHPTNSISCNFFSYLQSHALRIVRTVGQVFDTVCQLQDSGEGKNIPGLYPPGKGPNAKDKDKNKEEGKEDSAAAAKELEAAREAKESMAAVAEATAKVRLPFQHKPLGAHSNSSTFILCCFLVGICLRWLSIGVPYLLEYRSHPPPSQGRPPNSCFEVITFTFAGPSSKQTQETSIKKRKPTGMQARWEFQSKHSSFLDRSTASRSCGDRRSQDCTTTADQ